jgi:hypothetical protein
MRLVSETTFKQCSIGFNNHGKLIWCRAADRNAMDVVMMTKLISASRSHDRWEESHQDKTRDSLTDEVGRIDLSSRSSCYLLRSTLGLLETAGKLSRQ